MRNGDPVNAAIVSKYSTNAALTGRRIDLLVPRQRACGQLNASKQELPSVAVNGPVGRTHVAPVTPNAPLMRVPPGGALPRLYYLTGTAINECKRDR